MKDSANAQMAAGRGGGQVKMEFPVKRLDGVKLAKIAGCVLLGLAGGRLMIGWLTRLIVGLDVKLIAVAPTDGLCVTIYFGLTLSLLFAIILVAGPAVVREFKHYRLWLISVLVVALCGLFAGFAIVKIRAAYWIQQSGIIPHGKTLVDVRAVDIWLMPVIAAGLTSMYLGLLAALRRRKNL